MLFSYMSYVWDFTYWTDILSRKKSVDNWESVDFLDTNEDCKPKLNEEGTE